jgi:hypothetical protein
MPLGRHRELGGHRRNKVTVRAGLGWREMEMGEEVMGRSWFGTKRFSMGA